MFCLFRFRRVCAMSAITAMALLFRSPDLLVFLTGPLWLSFSDFLIRVHPRKSAVSFISDQCYLCESVVRTSLPACSAPALPADHPANYVSSTQSCRNLSRHVR